MTPSLLSRRLPLAMPEVQHDTLGRLPLACDFDEAVTRAGQWPLKPGRIEVLQINIGKLCNQTCRHCHVDAGPDRREVMTRETMTLCLEALEKTTIPTVDITGGAPEWKRELWRLHGIRFDALYCITNMPISRFLEWLIDSGNLETYMERLVAAFNPAAVSGLMCRSTLSVGWDGRLYDCDFNQMLDLAIAPGAPRHIRDFQLDALEDRPIVVGRHCFGCTAGAGSSCGGATLEQAPRLMRS